MTASGAGPPATPSGIPGEFGAEVASFAVAADGDLLLLDPLLPPDADPVLELLDGLAGDRVAILTTIPYHVRSAEDRSGAATATPPTRRSGAIPPRPSGSTTARGSARSTRARLCPPGCRPIAIGKPRRHEMPLYVPSQRALVFGDAVVELDGDAEVWANEPVDERRARFHRERFNPTLEPLLELDVERVLVTHGQPGDEERTGQAPAPR